MQKKREESVDVHDQELMIELGIHPNYRFNRDPNVWSKTPYEKELLKKAKHQLGRRKK